MNATEIKALRQRLSMTQARFADRVGASLRAVEEWESGRSSPRGLYLAALQRLQKQAERQDRRTP